MSHKSFFFIPDISGFTSFVKKVEIEHSRHIITELLELIIDSNQLDLSVAEVEGDAVFFYKKNEIPEEQGIRTQIEKTYVAFHAHLKQYETQRICPCGACSSAVGLQLKFVADAGNSQLISVKGTEKPFGESVIRVHRLLKNSIPEKEYVLLTDELLKESGISKLQGDWPKPIAGKDEYEELGQINYQSIPLSFLQKRVTYPNPPKKEQLIAKPLTYSITVKADKFTVFEWLTNMERRDQWNHDTDGFEFKKGIVNQKGYKHVCVIGNQKIGFETVTHDFGKDKLVYGEKTTAVPTFKEATSYFILEGDEHCTTINVEFHYQEKPIIGFLFKWLIISKITKGLKNNLNNLKTILENQ